LIVYEPIEVGVELMIAKIRLGSKTDQEESDRRALDETQD
jgi:hypothetical protein